MKSEMISILTKFIVEIRENIHKELLQTINEIYSEKFTDELSGSNKDKNEILKHYEEAQNNVD